MSKDNLSGVEAINQNPIITSLPDERSLPDCSTYATYRPIIEAAIPLITKLIPKVGSALTYLVMLADSVCQIAPSATKASSPEDMRRHLAETILNKAATDPAWKAQLINDPNGTLNGDAIGTEIEMLKSLHALAPPSVACSFSCIIST
ncbi:hypothetical protein U1707_04105 [Sphingomonas sp. PB2P12]|uniref:hypothetical protein n=1 Tax=Sphingomonas sandaracina TaxID=3096157 RepID=UPI002FC8FC65